MSASPGFPAGFPLHAASAAYGPEPPVLMSQRDVRDRLGRSGAVEDLPLVAEVVLRVLRARPRLGGEIDHRGRGHRRRRRIGGDAGDVDRVRPDRALRRRDPGRRRREHAVDVRREDRAVLDHVGREARALVGDAGGAEMRQGPREQRRAALRHPLGVVDVDERACRAPASRYAKSAGNGCGPLDLDLFEGAGDRGHRRQGRVRRVVAVDLETRRRLGRKDENLPVDDRDLELDRIAGARGRRLLRWPCPSRD